MMTMAVFMLAHQWSPSIGLRFARLRRETDGLAECFVLLQDDQAEVKANWTQFLASCGAQRSLLPFQPEELQDQLGFRWRHSNIMGNTHFPLLRVSRTLRREQYWLIESDVEYRGDWGALIGAFAGNQADLLASHPRTYAHWPAWSWWQTMRVPPLIRVRVDELRRAFFPVARLSRAALATIDAAHQAGWTGHFEALIPTVVHRAGLSMQDLLETVPCYIGDVQDPCSDLARQSTMRWRPAITAQEFSGRGQGPLLFHPVKDNWAFDGRELVRC